MGWPVLCSFSRALMMAHNLFQGPGSLVTTLRAPGHTLLGLQAILSLLTPWAHGFLPMAATHHAPPCVTPTPWGPSTPWGKTGALFFPGLPAPPSHTPSPHWP